MSRVGHRINTIAKNKRIDPNRLRALFALERLVARLESNEELSKCLAFKGGFVLVKTIETDRFTRDLDASAHNISQNLAQNLILEAVLADLKDGILFGDPLLSEIETTGDYSGLRIDLCFQLDVKNLDEQKMAKLPRIHLDISFGKGLPVTIPKVEMESVTEEDQFKVIWSIYPLEFIFAEKLQTLVIRGNANSRAKDVYDMSKLAQSLAEKSVVMKAIKNVFTERKTDLPKDLGVFVSNLDTLVLRSAWKSVLFKEIEVSFETALSRLVRYLEALPRPQDI